MSTSAIARYENESSIEQIMMRRPAEVLAEAKLAATELINVIDSKKNKVTFNGETYLEFEDWQMVAKFYGCTVKVESTNYVQFGEVHGFEATAIVLDRSQAEISRAESMCLNDEETWGMVSKYEWEDELDSNGKKIWVEGKNGKKGFYKGKKVKVGEAPKPLFQLRSMAQTRAGARALRQVFAWVVVLAGYKPSVAEEMTGDERPGDYGQQEERKPVTQPKRASEKQQEQKPEEGEVITGIIEDAKTAKSGALWITVAQKLVVIDPDKIDDDMKKGTRITLRVVPKNNEKIGNFYAILAILENPKEELKSEEAKGEVLPPDAAEAANALEGMMESGAIKKGSAIPEGNGKKPGTIGVKRAQQLYIIMTNNKAANGGLTEEILKKQILSQLPNPIEHLRDLEVGMVDHFEQMMRGEVDWKQFIEE